MGEGTRQREAFGWSMLRDKSVGFAVGVPTKLVRALPPRPDKGALWYEFEGAIGYSIGVRYGEPNCATMNAFYARMTQQSRAIYRARLDDWFAIADENAGRLNYMRAVCRSSGVLLAGITVPLDRMAADGVVLTAIADSLTLSRDFNATAAPHPKLDEQPTIWDFRAEQQNAPPVQPAHPNVDGLGKTAAIAREARTGAELRTEEVFERVAGAVYMVRADKRLGSAVAISANELLTNCHVVGELTRVMLARDKQELPADLVSMNVAVDRCVLRTAAKLPKWVTVRPYDDIKVGERALTVGTPQGLELTVAEGIVSSKRVHNNTRLIQTSAPISQGSSGGGLFDATGRLLGITTFYFKAGQNLNFAVAAEEYAR